ncbi:hypothetical protein SAFG77S_12267 [Streptomyces afghaniensis]
MTVAVVVFTSDLRLYDRPPLHAALTRPTRWFPCSSATRPSMRTASTCPTVMPSSPIAWPTSTPHCVGAVVSHGSP